MRGRICTDEVERGSETYTRGRMGARARCGNGGERVKEGASFRPLLAVRRGTVTPGRHTSSAPLHAARGRPRRWGQPTHRRAERPYTPPSRSTHRCRTRRLRSPSRSSTLLLGSCRGRCSCRRRRTAGPSQQTCPGGRTPRRTSPATTPPRVTWLLQSLPFAQANKAIPLLVNFKTRFLQYSKRFFRF